MYSHIFSILFSSTAMSTISQNDDNHVDPISQNVDNNVDPISQNDDDHVNLTPFVLGSILSLVIVVSLAILAIYIVVHHRKYHLVKLNAKDFPTV